MPAASRGRLPLVALLVHLVTVHGAVQVADSVQLIQSSVDAAAHVAAGAEAPPWRRKSRRSRRAPSVREASSRSRRETMDPSTDRLLIFWATGSSNRTMDLVVKNINHARRFEKSNASLTWPLQIDVYLAHYDMNMSGWKDAMGDWYSENVQFSAELKGIKFWLAKDLLLWNYSTLQNFSSGGRPDMDDAQLESLPKVDLFAYEYIWFLDEDVDFKGADLRLMIDLARRSGSNIMTPAIVMNWTADDLDHKHQPPPRPPPKNSHVEPWRAKRWREIIQSCMKYHNCSQKHAAAAAWKDDDSYWNTARKLLKHALENGEVGRPDLLGIRPVQNESEWSVPYQPGLPKHVKSGGSRSGCQVWDSVCHLQSPSGKCHIRYTNFVEVSFPLLKPKALVAVLHHCSVCLKHRNTIWGLDRVWCRKSASPGDENRSCAVLDSVEVMHMNYKTLPKWGQNHTSGYRKQDWDAFDEVQRTESASFAMTMETLSCFKYPKPDSSASEA